MLDSKTINKVKEDAIGQLNANLGVEELEALRVKFLGKKGELTALMKELGGLNPDERRQIGALLNEAKNEVENLLQAKIKAEKQNETLKHLAQDKIDVTLPFKGRVMCSEPGAFHPLTIIQKELESIFSGLGFTIVDGPELESEYYNFEALNVPSTHPARDMQDTFFTSAGQVLRTQTSAMQGRAIERIKPPLRVVGPGKCFRCERSDATHEHTFYQMEGMMIDKNITVGHLIYFMKTLLREIYGCEQKIRLRPGYFPFVEPGFELDIWFKDRWLELLPCGLVHPRVLECGGIDHTKWQGFAFGLGLSRLVMTRYKIYDIRYMQSGDLRFVKQFPRMISLVSE